MCDVTINDISYTVVNAKQKKTIANINRLISMKCTGIIVLFQIKLNLS